MTKILIFSDKRSNAQDVSKFLKKNERDSGKPASTQKTSQGAE